MKEQEQDMYRAIKEGDMDRVKELNVQCVFECGSSCLSVAVMFDHVDLVMFFVEKGVDVMLGNRIGVTPLLAAIGNGNMDIVRFLVDNGANVHDVRNDKVFALYIAAQKGLLEVVEYLVGAGSKIEQADGHGLTALYVAAENGHVDVVDFLVKNGANIEHDSKTSTAPLFIACEKGHTETVKCLLDHGAFTEHSNEEGATPLYIACQQSHKDIVFMLVEYGANILAYTNLYASPLSIASYSQDFEILNFLIDQGVSTKDLLVSTMILKKYDPNFECAVIPKILDFSKCVTDNKHKEAYEFICANSHWSFNWTFENGDYLFHHILKKFTGHVQEEVCVDESIRKKRLKIVIEILIRKGCRVHVEDAEGSYPIDIAIERDFISCAKLLAGGKVPYHIYTLFPQDTIHLLEKLSKSFRFPVQEKFEVRTYDKKHCMIDSEQFTDLLFSEIFAFYNDHEAGLIQYPPLKMKVLLTIYNQWSSDDQNESQPRYLSKTQTETLRRLLTSLQQLRTEYIEQQSQTSEQFKRKKVRNTALITNEFIHKYKLRLTGKDLGSNGKKRKRDEIEEKPQKKKRFFNSFNESMSPEDVSKWFKAYRVNSEGVGKFSHFASAFSGRDAESILNLTDVLFTRYLKDQKYDIFEIYDLYCTLHKENK